MLSRKQCSTTNKVPVPFCDMLVNPENQLSFASILHEKPRNTLSGFKHHGKKRQKNLETGINLNDL